MTLTSECVLGKLVVILLTEIMLTHSSQLFQMAYEVKCAYRAMLLSCMYHLGGGTKGYLVIGDLGQNWLVIW